MKSSLVPVAVLAVALAGGYSRSAVAEAVVGEAAPGFTLPDTTGQNHSLSDFSGKYVVLEWLNHDCPFVRKHYDSGNMQKLQKTYVEKGVIWLSICSSAPGKQGAYSAADANKINEEKGGAATAILLDPEGNVGRSYGAKVTPHMFVINPEGSLIYQGAIDDIPSASPGDIPNAKNYVAAALDAAMSGQPIERASSKPYGCSVKYN